MTCDPNGASETAANRTPAMMLLRFIHPPRDIDSARILPQIACL
jgi:hypothetical protein